MHRLVGLASACVAVVLGVACGGGYERPAIPDGGPGPTPECSGTTGCAMGSVCLNGRCYAACGPTSCAAGEVCNMGVCMPLGGAPPPPVIPPPPPIDGGGVDLGPVDGGPVIDGGGSDGGARCATVMCTAPLMCDPSDGLCVACISRECDTMAMGTCDVASGTCGTFTPAPCAPCDDAADCLPGSQCVASTSPVERTCLPSCAAGSCPRGMRCDERMLCVPIMGSCTERFRATQMLSCTMDSECTPRGTSIPMRCELGICRAPCTVDDDCPVEGASCFAGVCAGG